MDKQQTQYDADARVVFEYAMRKAEESGWDMSPSTVDEILHLYDFAIQDGQQPENQYLPIIFSHSFAKSFFKDDWKSHLQKMVLERPPIGYILNYLKDVYKQDL